MFRWAVSEEMLPAHVLEGLRSVEDLRAGGGAREGRTVGPVSEEDVLAGASRWFNEEPSF
jgi:hypothetical protein